MCKGRGDYNYRCVGNEVGELHGIFRANGGYAEILDLAMRGTGWIRHDVPVVLIDANIISHATLTDRQQATAIIQR